MQYVGMLEEQHTKETRSPAAMSPGSVLGLPCQGREADLWFAEQTQLIERAKELCQACPLVTQCLQGAKERHEPWGVWGGQVFLAGEVVAHKRGRGRPPKNAPQMASIS